MDTCPVCQIHCADFLLKLKEKKCIIKLVNFMEGMMNEQEKLLDEFAAALLAERGISEEVPEEAREKMKKEILERLNNFFLARCLESIPPEKLDALEGVVSKDDGREVWEYLRANIKDFDVFSMEVLADFRNKYLAI